MKVTVDRMRATPWGAAGGSTPAGVSIPAGERSASISAPASIVGWARSGRPTTDIDAVVISPSARRPFRRPALPAAGIQFVTRRRKPLVIVGPPGLRRAARRASSRRCSRVVADRDGTSPRSHGGRAGQAAAVRRHFDLRSARSACIPRARRRPRCASPPAARPSPIRATRPGSTRSVDIARDADLFVVRVLFGRAPVPDHIDWPTLRTNLPRLDRASASW